MKWASAVSDLDSLEAALDQCVGVVQEGLGSEAPDLAVVFASPHHAQDYERLPQLIRERVGAKHVIGCSAGGVIGGGQEIERRPGFSLTVARLPDVEINPFHVDNDGMPDLDAGPDSWEELVQTQASKEPNFLIITDPFSIRSENLILGLDYAFASSVKIGGMASGGQQQGDNALILDDQVYRSGAVGMAFQGDMAIDPIVAQGCRPIGRPMHVTKSQHNLLMELDDKLALDILRELFESLSEDDKKLVQHSLFLGVVMDQFQEDPRQGDFLMRNIVGMDAKEGALVIGEMLQEGQIVQFHLRDAKTSADDLSAMLARYCEEPRESSPAGALLFSCLGRGIYLYGRADHDTDLFKDSVGSVPLGGFFCNGEIGQVGGTTYLHGYTSSFGIFRPKSR